MSNNLKLFFAIFVVSVFFVSPLLIAAPAYADRLSDAIAKTPQGAEKGQIDPKAKPGWLGIQGAPSPSLILGFFWAIWVGWIFSTVGAFGGIMAGVGHITVFGLANYGKAFKDTSPVLNKLMTDSIRVSNQWLVGLSAAISSLNYYKIGRLVLPLGICLAIGAVGSSILVPIMTAGKISLKVYIGYFGLCVFAVALVLLWETLPAGQRKRKEASEAAKAFEKSVQEKNIALKGGKRGVNITRIGVGRVIFTFYGVEFSFRPIIPVCGGFFIAMIASFIGVGGGFLFVPFLTSIAGLPMFIVAGTSALTVLVGMIVSIFTYMVVKGTVIYWPLIGVELIGIFVGSMIGPRTSKYFPEIWLKRLFIVLAIYVGIRYTSRGFLGYSIVPPF
ncbi:MAG: hypothetical protein BA865_08470 [Desulfobacterales bacterium S5133MH4]|nr:MAG: hypothetical protein BA865_08470 [Desulfobacterales bacterium S5133MH4]